MIRRRLVLVTLLFTSLGVVFSFALPAVATITAPPGAGQTVPHDDLALQNPGMAAAMARDLHLTALQTQDRMRLEAWARRTQTTLRRSLGAAYAGSWINADADTLVVAVTDSAAVAKVRAAGAQPLLVSRTPGQLTAVKRTLDRAARSAPASVRGWYIDEPTNTVVLLAGGSSTSQAHTFVATSGADATAVRVVAAPAAFRPLADIIGGDGYLIDNVARCSVGFSVAGGFVTAGHCGKAGSTTTGLDGAAQGTFAGSTFPGTGDFALVKVNANWTPQPLVNATTGTVSVAGSQEAAIGSSVCRSGSTTGWHCGVIQAKDVTVNYAEGVVTGLTQTNVCAQAGDSGGSVISANQAQGVTSGGSGDCTVGGTTFFQPVNEILMTFQATLVTTTAAGTGAGGAAATSVTASGSPGTAAGRANGQPAGGAGAATPRDGAGAAGPDGSAGPDRSAGPDGSAGGGPGTAPTPGTNGAGQPATGGELTCANSQAIFRGTLTGPGDAQVQPNGTYYQTAATGSQLGCLDGPADAQFNLVLQRWDGHAFRTVGSASAGNGSIAVKTGPGYYRWQVTSAQGSGTYTLGLTAT